jgi:hypothetical protein
MMAKRWKTVLAGCVAAIVAVGGFVTYDTRRRQETIDAQAEEARQAAELQLLLDPARGPTEIDKRLRDKLTVQSGVVTIADNPDVFDTFAISAASPWTVSCHFGISVLFGPGRYEGPALQITDVQVPPEDCQKVAPLVGQRVRLLLTGAS